MLSIKSSNVSLQQVVFEGKRGTGYTGDIAIDDIEFLDSVCSIYPSSSVPQRTTTISPISTSTPSRVTSATLASTTTGFSASSSYSPISQSSTPSRATSALLASTTTGFSASASYSPISHSSTFKRISTSALSTTAAGTTAQLVTSEPPGRCFYS